MNAVDNEIVGFRAGVIAGVLLKEVTEKILETVPTSTSRYSTWRRTPKPHSVSCLSMYHGGEIAAGELITVANVLSC